jgi:hypothetical protein
MQGCQTANTRFRKSLTGDKFLYRFRHISERARQLTEDYKGSAPFKTYLLLCRDDWRSLAISVMAFAVRQSPMWVLPLAAFKPETRIYQP